MPLIRGTEPDETDDLTIPGLRLNRTCYYRPWAQARGDTNIVVRLGSWKGIWNADLDTFELYDLSADPDELNNVESDHPKIVDAMRARAKAWYEDCQNQPAQAQEVGELSEETLQSLRSLGYVE